MKWADPPKHSFARTIGHHFSISSLWCAARASGVCLPSWWDDLVEVGRLLH